VVSKLVHPDRLESAELGETLEELCFEPNGETGRVGGGGFMSAGPGQGVFLEACNEAGPVDAHRDLPGTPRIA
jgi:hypothetical protein